jgi:hypothetical protein
MDLDTLTVRELHTESARALSCLEATSNNIWQFNKLAHHNSHAWYKAVIEWYVQQYGGLPSQTGPGQQVKLMYNETKI